MSTSLKAVVQLILIVAVVVSICAWGVSMSRVGPFEWSMRIIAPIVTIAIVWLLMRDPQRKEKLPDLLREQVGNYFGKDGFCFKFVPVLTNGVLWMQLYYQNRYEGRCRATVMIRPPKTFVGLGRVPIDTLSFDVECDGAEFGVAAVPLAIPEKFQGKKVSFDVSCDTTYPSRRGRRLRYRHGTHVGGTKDGTGLSPLLLLLGHIHYRRSAKQTFAMPTGIASEIPADLQPESKTLWLPDAAGVPAATLARVETDSSAGSTSA